MEALSGGRDLNAAAGNLAMGCIGLVTSAGTNPFGGFIVAVSCGFIFGGGLKALLD
ncbi:hypothetical protein SAMN05444395_103122 [Flavobacterium fryxellicola]|uniref:hypothetical protein n=1 Tax=Flavobacterium fryxellicola TaxID=249352 RepID=UPI00091006B3|nr:hypothetical protein [Flavobacterium fryxellicola]SHN64452.1 hypothetical protein SAMN05444395_103122 [Flavobacterium fryxellicola]